MAKADKVRVGELDEHRRARVKAGEEGLELIERMTADVALLASFLEAEKAAVGRRGMSPKRLARLRLMTDDLSSATRFASKAIKT